MSSPPSMIWWRGREIRWECAVNSTDDDVSQLSKALVAIKQLRARLAAVDEAKSEPIAVIGIGCRFPGGVTDPDGFWQLMVDGIDAVTKVPATRWSLDDDGSSEHDERTGADFGAFMSDIDRFDPQFFGISPREARALDPQQRLLMETTVEALERSGQVLADMAGSRTGVFVGAHSHSTDYGFLQHQSRSTINAYSTTGTGLSILANRLSYLFDWKGPSLTVDTACSSSLVSTHLAVRSLRTGESDVALAAGVNLLLAPETAHAISQLQALSPDGRCKTFDAAADGFVRGEGCGVVVLKRLSDAERDQDPVLALIRGSAVFQDGATNGLTAPNGLMQQQVVQAALADGRVDPDSITLVEAHGTGTILGDPIEVEALTQVLGREGERPCALGSVKTNIGHLEGAAGIAGLIKVAMAMSHRTIPPHLHFNKLNPHISLDNTRFTITDAAQPWEVEDGPRRAGVSSFGIGGTNAHVVLEEAPETATKPIPEPASSQEPTGGRQVLVPLSARTPAALKERAARMARFAAATTASAADVAHTAAERRDHHEHRLVVSGSDLATIGEALSAFVAGEEHDGFVAGETDENHMGKPVFVFSGQGPELGSITRDLLDDPVFGQVITACDAALQNHADWSLLDQLTTDPTAEEPRGNDVVHVCLFAIQAGLAALWKSWGIEPAAVIGHSVGEIAAAHASGALTLEAGVEIALRRGQILNRASGLGTMVNVGLPEAETAAHLSDFPDVSVAVVNGPDSTVVSGDRGQLESLVERLSRADVFARFLTGVDYPSHSVLMEPFGAELAEAVSTAGHSPASIPVYSTSRARWVTDEAFDAAFWGANLRSPVMFAAGIEALVAEGHNTFVEISHHPMLQSSIAGVAGAEAQVVGSLRRGQPQRQHCLMNLAALHTGGTPVDWTAVNPGGRFVELPTYPWQRQRYWLADTGLRRPQGQRTGNLLLGVRADSPLPTYAQIVGTETMPFLADHRVAGRMILPTAGIVVMARAAAENAWGGSDWDVTNIGIDQALTVDDGDHRNTQLVLSTAGPTRRFQLFSDDGNGTWTQHAEGFLAPAQDSGTTAVDLGEVRERLSPVAVESHYASLSEAGLGFGPLFQGIQELWQGDGEALAAVAPPAKDTEEAGDTRAVVALDACLQALVTTIPGDDLYLLVGIERVSIPRWADVAWSHAVLRSDDTPDGQTVVGDVRFLDATGAVVGDADGVIVKRADAAALQRLSGPTSHLEEWLYEVTWRTEELTKAAPSDYADSMTADETDAGPSWLIFVDQHGVGAKLVEQLRSGGHAVRSVSRSDRFENRGNSILLDPTDPSQFALLAEVESGRPVRAVYLWGLDLDGEADPLDLTTGALHLVQHLSSRPSSTVWAVTSGAQSVNGESTAPAQAALWGLGRVVALELPDLWGGLIDLDGSDLAENASLEEVAVGPLVEELLRRDVEDQVAYRNGVRHVPRLVSTTVAAGIDQARFDHGVTLITGGLGGLGLQLAEWLVDRGARHLVLTGRTGLPDPATWDDVTDPELVRRVQAVKDLAARGVVVEPRAVDVGNDEQMAALVAELGQAETPLRHVFHLAMTVDDAPVTDLTGKQMAAMFAGKVTGGRILHKHTRDVPLDTFVVFSSTTALWGVAEMAHYAAANAYLDGLAHHRRASGLPALSINWGVWADIRETLEIDRERISGYGLRPMATDQALDALGHLIASDVAQVPAVSTVQVGAVSTAQITVADVDWRLLKGTYETRRPVQLLAAIELSGSAPATAGPAALAALLDGTEPHERHGLILDHVAEVVATVLGYADGEEEIDREQGLFDLGLDSLMAVELRERLEASVGSALPTTLIFNHPTVSALARFLDRSAPVATGIDDPVDAPSPDPSVPAAGSESADRAPSEAEAADKDSGSELLARFDDEIGKIDDLLRG